MAKGILFSCLMALSFSVSSAYAIVPDDWGIDDPPAAVIHCNSALTGAPTVFASEQEVKALFKDVYEKHLKDRLQTDIQAWILRLYFFSQHPNKTPIFREIFKEYAKAKNMVPFERVEAKLDEPEKLPEWDQYQPEVRRLFRASQVSGFKLLNTDNIELITKAVASMSREERLQLFRQAIINYKGEKIEPVGFFEVMYEVANRLNDKELVELMKDPRELDETVRTNGINRYILPLKIDQKFAKKSFGQFVKHFFKNGLVSSEEGNMYLAVLFWLSMAIGIGGAIIGTGMGIGIPVWSTALGISAAVGGVTLSSRYYNRAYPIGAHSKEISEQMSLKAAQSKEIQEALKMIGLASKELDIRSLYTPPPAPVPSGGLRIGNIEDAEKPKPKVVKSEEPKVEPVVVEVKPPRFAHLSVAELKSKIKGIHIIDTEHTNIVDKNNKMSEGWKRFKDFFGTLRKNAVGRDDLIQLIEYSLISGGRQNILLLGTTGVGKSFLADALGAIKDQEHPDEDTMFKLLLTPETSRSEVDGPLSYSKMQNDRLQRLTEDSILNFSFGFLDEIFDYPRVRNLLNILEEGVLRQGRQNYKGKLEFAIAATNKFITEIYQTLRGNNAQAPQDRFTWTYVVPSELSTPAENARLMNLKPEPLPNLYVQDLAALRQMAERVVIPKAVELRLLYLFQTLKQETALAEKESREEYESALRSGTRPEAPPYKSTRVYSNRSLLRAMKVLKTVAFYEWLKSGEEKKDLVATEKHLHLLENYFKLGGPNGGFLQRLINQTHEPLEKQQYNIVEQEGARFKSVIEKMEMDILHTEISQRLKKFEDLKAKGELRLSDDNKALLEELAELRDDIETLLKTYEVEINKDGLIEINVVQMPELQNRFNKLLGSLGI